MPKKPRFSLEITRGAFLLDVREDLEGYDSAAVADAIRATFPPDLQTLLVFRAWQTNTQNNTTLTSRAEARPTKPKRR